MEYYLGVADIAEYLGISDDSLNALIRKGGLPEPDAVLGGRFRGWRRETLDAWDERSPIRKRVDSAAVVPILTQLRAAAELVRAFGDALDLRSTGISGSVPSDLYKLAAGLESSVRSFAAIDIDMRQQFKRLPGQVLDTVDFRPEPVPTFVVFEKPEIAARVDQLRQAAATISRQAQILRASYRTSSTSAYVDALGAIAARIHEFADALTGETTTPEEPIDTEPAATADS